MGTTDRIERERHAKRTLMLEAARELFLESGYDAVTLRAVAQRIEYSTTAVYVHFKDKRDLIDQMVAEDFAKFTAALHSVEQVQPALLRLQRLGGAYVDFALSLPRHYQLLFLNPPPHDAKALSPAQPPPGLDGFRLLVTTIEECLADGAFRHDLRDAWSIAQVVWAAVHGLVSLLIVMGSLPHFDWRSRAQLMDTLMGSLIRGMMREGGEASASEPAPVKPRRAARGAKALRSPPRPVSKRR
jgi:AcrR family transcriptional regulator